jgi:nucleoside-diphosphate-sugar epimerase
MKDQPILVTGGCGFVGRHVVRYLLLRGSPRAIWLVDNLFSGLVPEVWLPSRFTRRATSPTCTILSDGEITITFLRQDIRQFLGECLRNANEPSLPRFGDVIHLASVVGGRGLIDGDPLLVATDMAIDTDLFHWARTVKPDRLLYASSSAAYPVHLQGESDAVALSEDFIDFGDRMGLPDMTYGWSKLTGEYLARIASRHYGLHTCCVRPFSGYGEDQEPVYPVPAIAERAARKEDPLTVWGTGHQGRDFVHIDDCVELMFRVLGEVSDGSAVNIGSGVLTTFIQVAELFAEISGYSPTVEPLVDKPVGVQNRYANTSLVQKRFGWSPKISLREGFERVFEAARNPTSKFSFLDKT